MIAFAPPSRSPWIRTACLVQILAAIAGATACAADPAEDGVDQGAAAMAPSAEAPPVLAMLRLEGTSVYEGRGFTLEFSPVSQAACRPVVAARGISGPAYGQALSDCTSQGVLAKVCDASCAGVEARVLLPDMNERVAVGGLVLTSSGTALDVAGEWKGASVKQSVRPRPLAAWNGSFATTLGEVTLSAATRSGVAVTVDGAKATATWATYKVDNAAVPAVGAPLTLPDGTTVALGAVGADGKRTLAVLGASP
jgi:hypothetical protein